MDYEKKYNEALERAKRLRDSFYQTMNAKRVVEEIFPELAESEDERIRKAIVATIEQCPYDFLNPKKRDEMLAYLERQKEPENVSATTMAPSCWEVEGKEQPEVGLEKEIEVASKRFPEVSFAKLSRIAKRFYELGLRAGQVYAATIHFPPCYNGGLCTNPMHDCINCPRQSSIGINTTTGTSSAKEDKQ